MYFHRFGLSFPPFRITPDTELFFPGAGRLDTLKALMFAIDVGDGIVKVTGEVGSGKTLLSRKLAKLLSPKFDVIYLLNPVVSGGHLLAAIAQELGLAPTTDATQLQLQDQLYQHLLKQHATGRRSVMFIDESQAMTLRALEEIRLLSNLETDTQKLLQVVLFGQPELDQSLRKRSVRQLFERIAYHFHLAPLTMEETREYVHFRLQRAGYTGGQLFSTSAIRLLRWLSRGSMRRINVLADKAMLKAYASDADRIGLRDIWAAGKDAQFERAGPRRLFVTASASIAVTVMATVALGLALQLRQLESPQEGVRTAAVTDAIAPNQMPEGLPPPAAGLNQTARLDTQLGATAFKTQHASNGEVSESGQNTTQTPDTRSDLTGRYGIQVLLAPAGSRDNVDHFVRYRVPDSYANQVYLVPLQHDGRDFIGVFFGAFQRYSAAKQALDNLPQSMARYSPYIRRIPAPPIWLGRSS